MEFIYHASVADISTPGGGAEVHITDAEVMQIHTSESNPGGIIYMLWNILFKEMPYVSLASLERVRILIAVLSCLSLFAAPSSANTAPLDVPDQKSDWKNLGGIFTSEPNCVSWGENRIDCFGIGKNKHMHHKYWDGSKWDSDWQNLGGSFISAPNCVVRIKNRIDCFAKGQDEKIYHRSWNGSKWIQWEMFGDKTFTLAPNCVARPHLIACLAKGKDNSIYHKEHVLCPLTEEISITFLYAECTSKKLETQQKFNRYYSDSEQGNFVTRDSYNTNKDAISNLALAKRFNNQAYKHTQVSVPKGYTIYEGIVAPQNPENCYPGGGNQIYLFLSDKLAWMSKQNIQKEDFQCP